MNKFRIALLGAAVLTAALFTPPARAGIQNTTFDGGASNAVNYVANAATNTPLVGLVATDAGQILVFAKFSCTASNTAAVTFRFDTSDGAGNWVTNGIPTWPITAAGTSVVTAQTNLNVRGSPLIRISQVENPGPGGVTNLLVNVWRKPGF